MPLRSRPMPMGHVTTAVRIFSTRSFSASRSMGGRPSRSSLEVCRRRDTPIMTFINKLDREGRSPIELLDEVESVLKIQCAPVTWPIGMGSRLKGVYHLLTGEVHVFEAGRNFTRQDSTIYASLDDPQLQARIGADMLRELRDELELVEGASH